MTERESLLIVAADEYAAAVADLHDAIACLEGKKWRGGGEAALLAAAVERARGALLAAALEASALASQ